MSPRKAGEVSRVTEPLLDLHPERLAKIKAAAATLSVGTSFGFNI
jgi:hypothetical protein